MPGQADDLQVSQTGGYVTEAYAEAIADGV